MKSASEVVRARVVGQFVDDALAESPSWIHANGVQPCIRDTRISVHGLVAARKRGLSDVEILKGIEGLTAADLEAAWEYYAQNQEQIDRLIRDDGKGERQP